MVGLLVEYFLSQLVVRHFLIYLYHHLNHHYLLVVEHHLPVIHHHLLQMLYLKKLKLSLMVKLNNLSDQSHLLLL